MTRAPSATAEFPLSSVTAQVVLERMSEAAKANRRPKLGDFSVLFHDGHFWFTDGSTIEHALADQPVDYRIRINEIAVLRPFLERLTTSSSAPVMQPFAALGDDRTLWMLRGYDRDTHRFTAVPVVVDLRSRITWPLQPRGQTGELGGTEPKSLFATGEANRFLLVGSVDAGAFSHLDEFIHVETTYDLEIRTCDFVGHRGQEARLAAPRTSVVGTEHVITAAKGLEYRTFYPCKWRRESGRVVLHVALAGRPTCIALDEIAPELFAGEGIDAGLCGLVQEDEVLVLDLRRINQAVAMVWR